VSLAELEAHTRQLVAEHAAYWRKDAREPGAEAGLTAAAVARLAALDLVTGDRDGVVPTATIARYAVDTPSVPATPDLFSDPS
jgi:hypothetical protein